MTCKTCYLKNTQRLPMQILYRYNLFCIYTIKMSVYAKIILKSCTMYTFLVTFQFSLQRKQQKSFFFNNFTILSLLASTSHYILSPERGIFVQRFHLRQSSAPLQLMTHLSREAMSVTTTVAHDHFTAIWRKTKKSSKSILMGKPEHIPSSAAHLAWPMRSLQEFAVTKSTNRLPTQVCRGGISFGLLFFAWK